jgi:hypothetical protein
MSEPEPPQEPGEVRIVFKRQSSTPWFEPLDWDNPDVADGHEHRKELIRKGLISPEIAANFPTDWCTCGHRKGAHDASGRCQAKACRKFGACGGYKADERYAI